MWVAVSVECFSAIVFLLYILKFYYGATVIGDIMHKTAQVIDYVISNVVNAQVVYIPRSSHPD